MYRSIFRPNLFADKVYLVTGGGTGIGRNIAHELASLGAHVIIAARKDENLIRTADEITQSGGSVSYHTVNIRNEQQIEQLFAAIGEQHPILHGLINNAGGQFKSPAANISLKGWKAVIDTNLNGTFMMTQAAFAHSFEVNGGVIVNMVAEMWRGFPGMAHTGAARAGVVNLTKTLAVEWARYGVRVNAVAPGLIDGNGIKQYPAAAQPFIQSMRQTLPAKRMGTEAEISAAVTFLLSPAAAYISGETIRVDGASSLWRSGWEIDDHDNAPPPFNGFNDE